GVNGSGKHNNWSLQTDDGINLLDPGKTPHQNVQFLLVLACILRAVDKHADLLRESAADPGNDHRLGADEAPPAIISVFLGDQLEDVVSQLIETGTATSSIRGGRMSTGVSMLPNFSKDATDRNRTSPFAFTGNKFEFRMVGSKDSIAGPNIVLDTIVAESFSDACDILEKAEDFDEEVRRLTKRYLTDHQKIIFNGNGYSEEWVEEAKKRGLPNLGSMVEAIPVLVTDTSIKMFAKYGVFSESELRSRVEIKYENYAKTIHIEALTMIDMASKSIIPAIIKWTGSLAGTIRSLEEIGASAKIQRKLLAESSDLLEKTQDALEKLIVLTAQAEQTPEGKERACFYHETVMPAMQALRSPVDRLEMIVDKDMWPMPSYGDLLFEV
ncbi:MAG: glutamine synthetase type III, partial [Lachnospiraceae bacterium]|nr:glutamine synthetase type III [Lachnospiraceae bacterium]